MKNQESAAEWVDTDDLVPWSDNPRKNGEAVSKIAKSIKRFGFGAPIVARRENGEIIAGHTRWAAAKKIGLKQVPVRYMDISERDAHALAIADNKLGEIAEWSPDRLAQVLSDFSLSEAAETGFDSSELAKLVDIQPNKADRSLAEGLRFAVVVECSDEDDQADVLERLEAEGRKCKPLVT